MNTVGVEDYLGGLDEVPAAWPAAALQAQAVAARTYALKATESRAPRGYDLCDDDRCQVYLGAQAESETGRDAAQATRGEVVTYAGSLADTFYSANAGGVTASLPEGFGGTHDLAYLPGGTRAPGGTDAWRRSEDPAAAAGRLGYAGSLDSVTVTSRGPSGRVLAVRLDGSSGPRLVAGRRLAAVLGLPSTLFTVHSVLGTADRLQPLGGLSFQVPPLDAGTLLSGPGQADLPLLGTAPELAGLSELAGLRALSRVVPPQLAPPLHRGPPGRWVGNRRLHRPQEQEQERCTCARPARSHRRRPWRWAARACSWPGPPPSPAVCCGGVEAPFRRLDRAALPLRDRGYSSPAGRPAFACGH